MNRVRQRSHGCICNVGQKGTPRPILASARMHGHPGHSLQCRCLFKQTRQPTGCTSIGCKQTPHEWQHTCNPAPTDQATW
eukprot:874130-Pelagomonas_calceolata.AAC.1